MGIKKIKKYRSEKDWKERVQAGKLRTHCGRAHAL